MAKKKSLLQKKIKKNMEELKSGSLHSGSKHGPLVKSQAQALAISYSEAKKKRKKKK